MKDLLRFPLNIQMFSEGDPEPEQPESPDVTQTEEYQKLKRQFDKTSSELAKLKNEGKKQLPEIERMKEEMAELKKANDNAKRELLNSKISSKLSSVGFDEKTINSIIEKYNDVENPLDFIDEFSKAITALVKKTEEESKAKFQQSTRIPGGSNSKENPLMKQILESRKSQQKPLDKLNNK